MTAHSPPDTGRRYTIEELSRRSRLSARTIRFYQTEGSLHPPAHHGRIAYYDSTHLARLQLIVDLKSRGLTLSAIQALIRESEGQGLSVEEWLRGSRRKERPPPTSGVHQPSEVQPPEVQQASPYQRWVRREHQPDPVPPTLQPGWHAAAPSTRERPSSWRSFLWGAVGVAFALSVILLAAAVISLQDVSHDRERLRRDVVTLQDRVDRVTAQLRASAPASAPEGGTTPPPALAPPYGTGIAPPQSPSPERPSPKPSAAEPSTAPDRRASPVEPSPSPPPPTSTAPAPPCTILPILQRCL